MNNIPYYYNYQNVVNSLITPSTSHVANSCVAKTLKRWLIQDVISRFYFGNIPEHWDKDYMLYTIFCLGYSSFLKTDKFGVIPQNCSLSGFNVFYRPYIARVINPAFDRTYDLVIGRDCEIVKLQPDYSSIMDIVDYYGNLMALCISTAEVNLLNSKLSYLFIANNKAGAEAFKKLYDDLASGNPAAVMDKDLINEKTGDLNISYFSQNIGQNFIAPQIFDTLRTLKNMFDTEIGIPNANVDKRERLTDDEVNVNNAETYARVNLWLDTLRDGFAKVNAMFGLNITVDFRHYDNPDVNDIEPDIEEEVVE